MCGTLGVGRASLPEFHAKREFDFAEKERLLNALAVVWFCFEITRMNQDQIGLHLVLKPFTPQHQYAFSPCCHLYVS